MFRTKCGKCFHFVTVSRNMSKTISSQRQTCDAKSLQAKQIYALPECRLIYAHRWEWLKIRWGCEGRCGMRRKFVFGAETSSIWVQHHNYRSGACVEWETNNNAGLKRENKILQKVVSVLTGVDAICLLKYNLIWFEFCHAPLTKSPNSTHKYWITSLFLF